MLLLVAAILMLVVGCEKPPVDASVSVLIVVGAGIIFLVTLGIRIRRVRALKNAARIPDRSPLQVAIATLCLRLRTAGWRQTSRFREGK